MNKISWKDREFQGSMIEERKRQQKRFFDKFLIDRCYLFFL